MGSAELPTLTVEKINSVIDQVCASVTESQNVWVFRRANKASLDAAAAQFSAPDVDYNLLFGVRRIANEDSSGAEITTENAYGESLCTFYLAYSTWQGRVCFVDYCGSQRDGGEEARCWSRLLSRLGLVLHCHRLVWTHYGDLPSYGAVTPETLAGWLTLYWKLDAMREFSGDVAPAEGTSLQGALHEALSYQQDHDIFRLRLATEYDVDNIHRLVLGLAHFEKEPESIVQVSKHQFRTDGFQGRPLYYCLLVEARRGGDREEQPHVCAIALCYVGYHLQHGRFLYLEDLFFEEPYRKIGGGTLVMRTLARAAQAMGCTKAIWQALDWNTPAL